MEGFKCKEKNWASSPDALGGQWGALNEGDVDNFEFSVTHQTAVWRGEVCAGDETRGQEVHSEMERDESEQKREEGHTNSHSVPRTWL